MRMTKPGNSLNRILGRTGWRWLAGCFLGFFTYAALPQVALAQAVSEPVAERVLPRCGTVSFEQFLQQRNPSRRQQLDRLNQLIERTETDGAMLRRAANVIYRIPVVVHVIHNNASNTVGGSTNGNISDEQIASQIQVLNEDYRRQAGTNGFNDNPIGADAGIEFFLATTDPQGQPTNGITRHYNAQESFETSDALLLSRIAYWPSDRYLNIWVTRLNDFLGYTQFPSAADTLTGLGPDREGDELIDGSIIDYRYFGRQIGTVRSTTYGYGRTATHEIGHWLGLIHTWGDGVCATDYVADTPPAEDANQTTFCREKFSECSGVRTRNLIENYLDYSPDLCMNMFTQGQVGRMRAVLALSPRRVRLIQSVEPLPAAETLTVNVYPNPAETDPTVEVLFKGTQSFTLSLFDISGRLLRESTYPNSASTRLTLPTNRLATGVYVVRVTTGSETTSQRVLVR